MKKLLLIFLFVFLGSTAYALSVHWDAPQSYMDEYNVTGFKLYVKIVAPDGTIEELGTDAGPTERSYNLDNFDFKMDGTVYHFGISGVNEHGVGPVSEYAEYMPINIYPPGPEPDPVPGPPAAPAKPWIVE